MEEHLTLNDILSSSQLSVNDVIVLMDEGVISTIGEPREDSEWYFARDSRAVVMSVDNLMTMGYPLKDAVKIVKNFGNPENRKNPSETRRNRKILFTPSELARLFAVSPRAVKYWEEKQLIRPFSRSKSGIRFYHKKTKIEIMLLKAFQSLGFSLDKIKVFLDLYNFILEDVPGKKPDTNKIQNFLANLDSLDRKLAEFETSVESLKKLSGKGRQKLNLYLKRDAQKGDKS